PAPPSPTRRSSDLYAWKTASGSVLAWRARRMHLGGRGGACRSRNEASGLASCVAKAASLGAGAPESEAGAGEQPGPLPARRTVGNTAKGAGNGVGRAPRGGDRRARSGGEGRRVPPLRKGLMNPTRSRSNRHPRERLEFWPEPDRIADRARVGWYAGA